MEALTCRLLPYDVADGPTNMATDEALLRSAEDGVATLRFYSWSPATLSLGYFQPENLRRSDPVLAALPFVRRPTGGDTLVHHHELTYALALPAGPWQALHAWPVRMHEVIVAALSTFGVVARLFTPVQSQSFAGPLCFDHHTRGDVMIGPAKIVGSAQRKRRGSLLQHGGILLARSSHAPSLAGIRELARIDLLPGKLQEAITAEFAKAFEARVVPGELTLTEIKDKKDLKNTKYTVDAWNCKR